MFSRYAKAEFQPERAVYIVRNPFNAIRSYFHLEVGGTHNQSITDTEYGSRPTSVITSVSMLTCIAHALQVCNRLQERADKWAYYVDRQPAVWVNHVDHWIRWSSLKPDRLLLLR